MLKRLFLILFFSSPLFAAVNDHRDFQVWIFDSIHKSLSKKNSLVVESEVRFADEGSILYVGYIQALFKHQLRDWCFIAPGYRQFWSRSSGSVPFRPSYNPFLDFEGKITFRHFTLSDRNRIQYVIFNSLDNHMLYRNRIYIATKRTFGSMKAVPFISEELFFVERIGFEQNRLSIGVGVAPTWPIVPKIFYMRRDRKDASRGWEYQNICGIQLFSKF